MSATTSPSGNSSGRASVPGPGRPDRGQPPHGTPYGGDDFQPAGPRGPRPPGATGRAYGGGGGRRPRPRWGRIALVAGGIVLVLAIVAGISAYGYFSGLDDDLKRTNAFSGITADRPNKAVEGAFNILLIGTDSRDPDAVQDKANQWRADTLILMHVPADHKSAQLISIPRDLWVSIPTEDNAPCGTSSRAKINAAFAFGGIPRAVRTVECMTDVRIDHVMTIDFSGFKEVTDALGGVDLKVEQDITSIHKPFREFKKGMMHMNGAQALDWVRQRKQFARGDFARMQHQQDFLKAIMDKAASSGTLTSPTKLDAFLGSVTKAVTVDETFSLTDMAVQFRNLRGENLTFLTSPNSGSDTIDGQSVVVADREKALALYKAVADDKMAEWLAANPVKK
ncbi:cell envelope-related function transcriptional attenuator common domain-containing protein [Actinoplanes philippinensis]|uniref:Cell envelope-related function transcriptional attenuator common domain-containing protein n=1 Tax=Actinoplanes philippinensis TaxID=35752 RepID=A0A1I2LJT9_9ACTN|nr:LCP family protein [Actinoplanes philippinensis]SFF78720.1 cell envelope-related function transcriptional attenuator common domain-containing protein [Actinoplanes philippinensis]